MRLHQRPDVNSWHVAFVPRGSLYRSVVDFHRGRTKFTCSPSHFLKFKFSTLPVPFHLSRIWGQFCVGVRVGTIYNRSLNVLYQHRAPTLRHPRTYFSRPKGFKRRTLLSQEVRKENGIITSIDKLQLPMCRHSHCVSGSNLVPALSLTRYQSSCSAVSSEIHRGHKPLHRQSTHLKC